MSDSSFLDLVDSQEIELDQTETLMESDLAGNESFLENLAMINDN